MTWNVAIIPPAGLKTLWPIVAPLLAPAIRYSAGRIDMRSTFEWLMDERYQLWVVHGEDKVVIAALVTREAWYPRRGMLTVDLCGGSNLVEWASDATRVLRNYARDAGLEGVELFGRRGWARALKPYGWTGEVVLVEVNAAAEGEQ
jgi:hypothetical protein